MLNKSKSHKALLPWFISLIKSANHNYQHAVKLSLALFITFLGKVAMTASAFFYRDVINHLSPVHQQLLLLPVGFILLFGLNLILVPITQEIREYLTLPVIQRTNQLLLETVFKNVLSRNVEYHTTRETGKLTQLIQRALTAVEMLINVVGFQLIPAVIETVIIAVILFVYFDMTLTLWVVASALTLSVFMKLRSERYYQQRQTVNQQQGKLSQKLLENFTHLETILSFGQQQSELKRLKEVQGQHQLASQSLKHSESFTNLGRSLILIGTYVGLLFITASRVVHHQSTIGDFVLINMLFGQIYQPLLLVGQFYHLAKQAIVDLTEMQEFLAEGNTEEITENIKSTNYLSQSQFTTPLSFSVQDLTFSYEKTKPLFKNINMEIHAGECIVITGSTGLGKTTLMKLIIGRLSPSEGRVFWDDLDIHNLSIESRQGIISIVSQDCALWNETLAYNIAYGCPNASLEAIIEAAKSAHIHDEIIYMPEGYHTQVGESGVRLSGGQKQRISLARAIIQKSRAMIMDEPTSSIDSTTENAIKATLAKLKGQTTLIIVTHRLTLTEIADRIFNLSNGELQETQGNKKIVVHELNKHSTHVIYREG